jgi:hypothetical protein
MTDPTTITDPIYQGEGKWFKFTLTRNESAIDLDALGATFTFFVKASLSDVVYAYEAPSEAFDLTNSNVGIVRVNIPASITSVLAAGAYFGQLKSILVADLDVDLSQIIKFKIKTPVVSA